MSASGMLSRNVTRPLEWLEFGWVNFFRFRPKTSILTLGKLGRYITAVKNLSRKS